MLAMPVLRASTLPVLRALAERQVRGNPRPDRQLQLLPELLLQSELMAEYADLMIRGESILFPFSTNSCESQFFSNT